MTELQRLARRLADDYQFECHGGPLRNCQEWRALCEAIDTLAVDPPPSGASSQAETVAKLLLAARQVASFARAWEPLSPGDIRDLTKAIEAMDALPAPVSPVEPTGASPPADPRRDCTCLGTCRGAEGLGPRWKCALETPAPVSPVEPTPEPPQEKA